MLITQDQRSIIFPVIVTLLSDTTTSNIAGDGDHTNSAVAPAKAYRWVKDYLELTMVNQNQAVTLSDVHDYKLRDLNVMNLQIVIAQNCSHVYKTTPRPCDIRVSYVSLGNKGCHFIWHVDPEITTGNAPRLAACVHSLKKPKSYISCMTMPAAKSTFLWQLCIKNKEQYMVHLSSSSLPFISHLCIL